MWVTYPIKWCLVDSVGGWVPQILESVLIWSWLLNVERRFWSEKKQKMSESAPRLRPRPSESHQLPNPSTHHPLESNDEPPVSHSHTPSITEISSSTSNLLFNFSNQHPHSPSQTPLSNRVTVLTVTQLQPLINHHHSHPFLSPSDVTLQLWPSQSYLDFRTLLVSLSWLSYQS